MQTDDYGKIISTRIPCVLQFLQVDTTFLLYYEIVDDNTCFNTCHTSICVSFLQNGIFNFYYLPPIIDVSIFPIIFVIKVLAKCMTTWEVVEFIVNQVQSLNPIY